jgi:carbon-monoxide dehydrogenase medium subunit
VRLKDAEQALMGQAITPARITEAANATEGVEATGDIHAGAEYRRHLGRVLTGRALVAAVSRARQRCEKAADG